MQSRNKLPARTCIGGDTANISLLYRAASKTIINVAVIFFFILIFSPQKHSQRATGLADSAEFIPRVYIIIIYYTECAIIYGWIWIRCYSLMGGDKWIGQCDSCVGRPMQLQSSSSVGPRHTVRLQ